MISLWESSMQPHPLLIPVHEIITYYYIVVIIDMTSLIDGIQTYVCVHKQGILQLNDCAIMHEGNNREVK